MHCPDCERVRALVHDANTVHVVAPTGFTLDKIRAAASAAGLMPATGDDPEVIRLDVPRAAFARLADALVQRLSIEERAHSRALVLPAGVPVTVRDWLGTRPLQGVIGWVRAAWLVACSRRSGWSRRCSRSSAPTAPFTATRRCCARSARTAR